MIQMSSHTWLCLVGGMASDRPRPILQLQICLTHCYARAPNLRRPATYYAAVSRNAAVLCHQFQAVQAVQSHVAKG